MRSWISSGLLAVFVVTGVGCEGADVPGAPPMTAGPARSTTFQADEIGGGGSQMSVEEAAEIICNKYAFCLGEIADQGLQQCADMVAGYMGIIIDIAAFVSCFDKLSCEELLNMDQGGIADQLQQCLDIDPSSAECTTSGMSYCNNQGQCKEIDCQTWCSMFQDVMAEDMQSETIGCCECHWQRPGDPPQPGQPMPDQPSA